MEDGEFIPTLCVILYILLLVWLHNKGIERGATEYRREYEEKKRRMKEFWEEVEKWREQLKLWKGEK